MIYLSRKNIDIEKWNACIEASSSLPYAYSWYLDEMCPAWDALILEKEGRYVACFPVPWKSKLGLSMFIHLFLFNNWDCLRLTIQLL